jgi:hypothetical protein
MERRNSRSHPRNKMKRQEKESPGSRLNNDLGLLRVSADCGKSDEPTDADKEKLEKVPYRAT